MQRRDLLKLAGAAAGAALVPAAAARACRVFPADGESRFAVLRQGRPVGTHRIAFARGAGAFVARSDVEVEVGRQGVPAARFVHHLEETWVDGWLDAAVSDTEDNGRRYRLRAERRDGILQGAVNGAAFTVSGYVITTSLWHRDTPSTQVLFDTVDARVKVLQPRLIGREKISARGATIEAKHYALGGEYPRDVWYDAECNLVRFAHVAADGVQILSELR